MEGKNEGGIIVRGEQFFSRGRIDGLVLFSWRKKAVDTVVVVDEEEYDTLTSEPSISNIE